MGSGSNEFQFVLNGQPACVAGIPPGTTLLDYIRSRNLTGAKEGCAEGECGACAVLLLSSDGAASRYQSVNSCLIPLPAVAGREVYTVEALAANGELCEAQKAMAEWGGSQCGYCTPGFVISMVAAQYSGDSSRDQRALGGNLCRCTGYRPIRDAFRSLGPAPDGPLRRRLERPTAPLGPLEYKAAGARFSRPTNLAECFALLSEDPAARLVAGNTDLGLLSNLRDERFPHLISLEAIDALREFHETEEFVELGAALTLSEIEERWRNAPEVLGEWLPLFASPLIRNRATLGGNLSTASPIGDAAPLLMSLDAEVELTSAAGERTIPLHTFFTGYRQTILRPGELLQSIRIPKPYPDRAVFYKVAKRSLDDISTVAAAFTLRLDQRGLVETARLAFGGVAPIPIRVPEAERAIEETRPGRAAWSDAKRILARTLRPLSDHRGSAEYRLAMAQSLLDKFAFALEKVAA